MIWLFAVLAFVTILGTFMYLHVPSGRWRIAGVATYVALVAVIFAGALEGLGQARPLSTDWQLLVGWRSLAHARIVGAKFIEGEAIYLYLDLGAAPLSYVLPWNVQDAQSIQDAIKGAKEQGGIVRLTRRIDRLPDAPKGDVAEVVPPEALPPKEED